MIRKMVTISSLAMALAIGVPQLASARGGGGFGGGHFSGGSFGGGISHFSGSTFAENHFASAAHVGAGHYGSVGHYGGHLGHHHFAFHRHGRNFFVLGGPFYDGYYDGYDYDDDACYEQVHTRRGWRWIWVCD